MSDRVREAGGLCLLALALGAIIYTAPRGDGLSRAHETRMRLSTNPESPVAIGEELLIKYEHSGRAGGTVTISIGDGSGDTVPHELQLDERGVGEFRFEVPDWIAIQLNGPDSQQRTLRVR